jgi:NAD(P)H-flavin reductase
MDAMVMPEPPAPFRVLERRHETHDTWTLRLAPVGDGPARAAFAPGQFAMLFAFGAGEAPISVSAVEDDGVLVHTVRAVGAVTRALCAAEPGAALGVRGPFGTAWPLAEAEGRDVVIVAGGIGLAPLRPVVHELLTHRERYGDVSILYGGRSPEELLYVHEVERWRGRFDVSVEVIVDAADSGWHGRVGVVTRLIPRATFDPDNTVAMMCGPEVMMRFAAPALQDSGLGEDRIWLSLERSMECAVGHCGHCQLGPLFICKDGPVLRHDVVAPLMRVAEL